LGKTSGRRPVGKGWGREVVWGLVVLALEGGRG